MVHQDCDFSPLKRKLKEDLLKIASGIEQFVTKLDDEQSCLLSEFVNIRENIIHVESIASSFYLQCYLSPYTSKYLDISTSIQHLSDRKHGALIVVQRKMPLNHLLYQGVPIHAILTNSLLESIFYPGNPLHDGAVLLQGDQIVSAAHVLPLSHKKTDTEQKIGTRHRAALGLSEQSDALIIVLSEETGHASFALNGELFPLNANDLNY